jgi:hypothetical protein
MSNTEIKKISKKIFWIVIKHAGTVVVLTSVVMFLIHYIELVLKTNDVRTTGFISIVLLSGNLIILLTKNWSVKNGK